jgi:3-oxoacyl-[acyl-carrier-protein] synthase-1
MQLALGGFDSKGIPGDVVYINAHGTSTPAGDSKELAAFSVVFTPLEKIPYLSSTKSLTGHSLGATGVQEVIYTLLMMKHNFIAASANIKTPDPEIGDIPVVTERIDSVDISVALSNSFGFGGTNATIALAKIQG